MFKSIADYLPQFNKNFSSPTVVGSVTTRKSLKLHSADIAYLKVVKWFQFRAKNQKCYLTKEDWPVWLERFGGKKVHYRKQKARWAKMRALGYIVTKRTHGNMNKEYEHYLTLEGKEALEFYEKLSTPHPKSHEKTAPREDKKRPPENEKTAPPLNVWIKEDKKEEEFYSFQERTEIIKRQRQILRNFEGAI
jgi:hypothetical protein